VKYPRGHLIAAHIALKRTVFMTIAYLRIKGEEMGCRVDIDSVKEMPGGMLQYDDYSGKAATFRGRVIFPAAQIEKIEIPRTEERASTPKVL